MEELEKEVQQFLERTKQLVDREKEVVVVFWRGLLIVYFFGMIIGWFLFGG